MLDNHKNTQKDAILLFKVGQTLIQTIIQRRLLFKEIIQETQTMKLKNLCPRDNKIVYFLYRVKEVFSLVLSLQIKALNSDFSLFLQLLTVILELLIRSY